MADLLGIAITGLNASQQALDVVGHNIANAATPGYSRQIVDIQANSPTSVGGFYVGNGVDVFGIKRAVDSFLEASFNNATSSYENSNTYLNFASVIDNLIADPNVGISQGLYNFFTGVQEVINDPSSLPARQVLLSQAQILQNNFNTLDNQLLAQNTQVNNEVAQIIAEINVIGTSIANYNTQIVSLGISTSSPNDLLDQRDHLIEQLAQLVSVTTISQDDGSVNVFIGQGYGLVVGTNPAVLAAKALPGDPTRIEVGIGGTASTLIISDTITGGQLAGTLAFRNEILESTRNALGRLAITVASVLNDQHVKGIDLNGNLGGFLFKDVNDITDSFSRVLSPSTNIGKAVIGLNINSMPVPENEPPILYSTPGILTTSGTLTTINTNNLSLNGVVIPISTAANDLLSTSDNAASSIAFAAAINSGTNVHQVKATVLSNECNLGTFTTGTFSAGDFSINGSSITGTFASSASLVTAINAFTSANGVYSEIDSNGSIILTAKDGRNIQLQSNTATPTATFQYFSTSSATALNKVQRGGLELSGPNGTSIVIGGSAPSNAGLTAGSTPIVSTSLTTNNYQLSYNGSIYSLTRDDGIIYTASSVNNFSVDGFSLSLEGGSVAVGDIYYVYPTRTGANKFELVLSTAQQLALAYPVSTQANLTNNGTGIIEVTKITDTSGTVGSGAKLGNAFQNPKSLTPPLMVVFNSPTSYRVYDVTNGVPGSALGPEQVYNPLITNELFPLTGLTDTSSPGPNPTYTWDPGYRISISGIVSTGDEFSVGYNTNGISDNRNAVNLLALSTAKVMQNQTANFQDSYSLVVADVGSKAQNASLNAESNLVLQRSAQDQRDQLSGVNLDEEAAALVRYEQLYSASAQLILTAKNIFDALMSIVGR